VLDGVQIPPCEGAILRGLRGKGRPIAKYRTLCSHICKDGCNQFWDAACYNWLFGFRWLYITLASDTLFDSRAGFSGSSYPVKT